MYADFEEELKRIILAVLEEEQIELVELVFARNGGRSILKLLVDRSQGGITIQDCARLNEKIGKILDAQDTIRDRYMLEVSSPGLDRPLKTRNDFLRCLSREVRFFLNQPLKGKVEISGIIRQVKDASLEAETREGTMEINFTQINRAKQVID